MAEELSATNFIKLIKKRSVRDRKKISFENLIKLIVAYDDDDTIINNIEKRYRN